MSDFIASTADRSIAGAGGHDGAWSDVIDMDAHFDRLFATYAARLEDLAAVA